MPLTTCELGAVVGLAVAAPGSFAPVPAEPSQTLRPRQPYCQAQDFAENLPDLIAFVAFVVSTVHVQLLLQQAFDFLLLAAVAQTQKPHPRH